MTTKHTPGPWEIRPAGKEPKPCLFAHGPVNGIPVARFEHMEDARLCAAAPRMFELIRKLANAPLPFGDEPHDIDDADVLEARSILEAVE